MRCKPLNRRTFLKGMLGGSAIALALPPLEAFMNVNGTAYAESAFPVRYGSFFWGNGVQSRLSHVWPWRLTCCCNRMCRG